MIVPLPYVLAKFSRISTYLLPLPIPPKESHLGIWWILPFWSELALIYLICDLRPHDFYICINMCISIYRRIHMRVWLQIFIFLYIPFLQISLFQKGIIHFAQSKLKNKEAHGAHRSPEKLFLATRKLHVWIDYTSTIVFKNVQILIIFNLVEIGPVVMEKKSLKCRQCIFIISLSQGIPTLKRTWSFVW